MEDILLWIFYIATLVLVGGASIFFFGMEISFINATIAGLLVFLVLKDYLDDGDSASYLILYMGSFILFGLAYGWFLFQQFEHGGSKHSKTESSKTEHTKTEHTK